MAKSGVYKIQSLIKPDRIYIGSSNNIHRRWNEHLREMKSNTHHSSKLKNHVSKYGVADLQFSILLECGSQDLITREQDFIDALNPYFNGCKIAGCPGAWNKGMNLSKEHCDNLSKSHIGQVAWNKGLPSLNKGVPMKEEQKEKIRQTKIGEKNPMFGKLPSEESRQKMRESRRKYYNSPEGIQNRKESSERLKENHPMSGKHHTEETLKKMRKPRTEQARKNMSKGQMGRVGYWLGKKRVPFSETTKQKMRNRDISETTRQKLRDAALIQWQKQKQII